MYLDLFSLKLLNMLMICRPVFRMYPDFVAGWSDKKSPTLNKNISVNNIRAQIENMSSDENAGFRSEYNVRLQIPSCRFF